MNTNSWKDLTRLTHGAPFQVERVRMVDQDVAIEGRFDPPPLALLPLEDQVFVSAFVKSHGSIKEMERLFGVSYPTIKNRLNRIGERLGPEVTVNTESLTDRAAILTRLEQGEITAQQALEALAP